MTSKLNDLDKEEMILNISGMGIIMYSDFSVSNIKDGEDYFSANYQNAEQVVKHIYEGSIVGFSTSSSGTYKLKFKKGYPRESEVKHFDYKLRLAIEVRDERICIRDLFDLMNWQKECPDNQCISVSNGFYHITLCGNMPKSGILGDDQEIFVYLEKLVTLPELKYNGVPVFCE